MILFSIYHFEGHFFFKIATVAECQDKLDGLYTYTLILETKLLQVAGRYQLRIYFAFILTAQAVRLTDGRNSMVLLFCL